MDFALVAFAGSFLLGIAVLSRTAKRIEKVGPESDEGQQLLSDASSHCCASTCCFLRDRVRDGREADRRRPVVAIVALALVAGSAAFLRRAVPRAA